MPLTCGGPISTWDLSRTREKWSKLPPSVYSTAVLYREGVFLGVGDDRPGCFLGGLDPVRRSRFGRESKIGPFWPSGCVLAVLSPGGTSGGVEREWSRGPKWGFLGGF